MICSLGQNISSGDLAKFFLVQISNKAKGNTPAPHEVLGPQIEQYLPFCLNLSPRCMRVLASLLQEIIVADSPLLNEVLTIVRCQFFHLNERAVNQPQKMLGTLLLSIRQDLNLMADHSFSEREVARSFHSSFQSLLRGTSSTFSNVLLVDTTIVALPWLANGDAKLEARILRDCLTMPGDSTEMEVTIYRRLTQLMRFDSFLTTISDGEADDEGCNTVFHLLLCRTRQLSGDSLPLHLLLSMLEVFQQWMFAETRNSPSCQKSCCLVSKYLHIALKFFTRSENHDFVKSQVVCQVLLGACYAAHFCAHDCLGDLYNSFRLLKGVDDAVIQSIIAKEEGWFPETDGGNFSSGIEVLEATHHEKAVNTMQCWVGASLSTMLYFPFSHTS